jgi:hypothetical protein
VRSERRLEAAFRFTAPLALSVEAIMLKLWSLVRGGFLKAYRAETLGIAAGLSAAVHALAQWAVGDRTLISLIRGLAANWTLIAGGLGLATLGAKLARPKPSGTVEDETVAAIADKALRR